MIAAVRLPAGTHRSAGTDVVTDLLILRRPLPGEPRPVPDWINTVPLDLAGEAFRHNGHFAGHPNHVLGTYQPGGAYRRENLNVVTHRPVHRFLADTLRWLTVDYRPVGDAPQHVRTVTVTSTGRRLPAGSIAVDNGSPTGFSRDARPHKATKSGHARLTALCGLRDLALDYLHAPSDDGRHELASLYDTYRAQHPPLNHYTLGTSTIGDASDVDDVDPDSGEVTRIRRAYLRYDGFRSDPSWWTVAALEHFDDETGTGTPAPILQHPTVDPHREDRWPARAETLTLAVANSLARFHRVDVDYIATQLETNTPHAAAQLATVAFEDPVGGWELAATYLAGDVVGKLDQADTAVRADPDRYGRNVDALRAVLPTPLTQAEITPELGVTWLTAEDITGFVREMTGSTSVTVYYHPPTGRWSTDGWATPGPAQFRTDRHDLTDQVVRACNATPVTVMSTIVDANGREQRVVNPDATAAEQLARDNLNEALQRWCWANPERAGVLAARYNRLYNRYQPVHYDGTHLTLPGLSTGFTPRPHQKDVVWRILTATDSGTLMAHGVGAGKTAAMIIAGQEARRTGRVTGTTLYAVPGNMVEQFARDYLGLYPGARVITPRATDRDSLREFAARVATGDFDAAICSHQAIKKIPLHPDTERAQLQRRLDDFDSTDPDTTLSRTARRHVEKRVEALRQQLTALTEAAADPTITYFDRMNVRMLFVDEAHLAKNIALNTARQGLPLPDPSQLAEAILARADIVRSRHGPAAVVMATATPVTNSPAEMWVTARLVSPAALTKAGMGHFDAFAANFLSPVESIEHTAGGKLKMVTRLADYRNFPDLARMFRSFTDIRQTDQLGFDLPTLTGGQATVHVVAPSDQQLQVAGWARERANGMHTNLSSGRVIDPVIAILGVARAAALHPATISSATLERWATTGYPNLRFGWDEPNPKLAEAADTIAHIHHTTTGTQYPGSTVTGAVQVVFCDQGVPDPTGGPSVYSTLTQLLVDRGVQRQQIGWVHDWPEPATRQPLWDQARHGQIRVLIGSTQQMGVGVNIQTRLYAAHELTAPYRPDWLTQAEGRMIRQGNLNPTVQLHRYVSERTADATSWQILQRKAHFIHTAMSHPDTLTRDLRDESVQTPAEEFAQIAALATGDQRHIELAALTATVTRLERGERAHHASINNQQQTIRAARHRIDTLHQQINTLTALTPRLSQDAQALGRKILEIDPGSYTLRIDGVLYQTRTDHDGLRLKIVDTDVTIRITHDRLRPADEGRGLGTTIINHHRQLPYRITELRQQLERTTRQHDAELDRPVPTHYPRASELVDARQRHTELTATLQPDQTPLAAPALATASVQEPTVAQRWAAIGAFNPYDPTRSAHWGNRAHGEHAWAAAVNQLSTDPANQHPSRRHEIGLFHGVALIARISATTVHIGPRSTGSDQPPAGYETTPGHINPDDLARWLADQHRDAVSEQRALRSASTNRSSREVGIFRPQHGR